MQIYADVTGREMKISRSAQTCALGSAICGAVVGGAFPSFAAAQEALCGVRETVYRPNPAAHEVYSGLFELYSLLHDAFGRHDRQLELYPVMKRLLEIRDQALV
jgi:L-ribulokinase